jgi:hypothetical protein
MDPANAAKLRPFGANPMAIAITPNKTKPAINCIPRPEVCHAVVFTAAAAVGDGVRVTVVVAVPLVTDTSGCANEQVYPAGREVVPVAHVSAIVPVNPPLGMTVTVPLPALPATIANDDTLSTKVDELSWILAESFACQFVSPA